MDERVYECEWDEHKAAINEDKHGVAFQLASTRLFDPNLLTVADLEHSDTEERWFESVRPSSGAILSVAYTWSENRLFAVTVRLISARKATRAEVQQYKEVL